MASLVFGGQVSTSTLASLVGYVPSAVNMLHWTSTATASDFTVDYWIKTQVTITTGVMGPTGHNNAQTIIPSAVNTSHIVEAQGPITGSQSPIPMRVAVLAKANGYSRIVVYWKYYPDASGLSVGFDLTGGNFEYDVGEESGYHLDGSSMTDKGNGWWLCIVDGVRDGEAGGQLWQPQIRVDNGSGTAARSISFAGNTTSGVNVAWFNVLPKAAWDLTVKSLDDHFTSLDNIDLNHTKIEGFKWYTGGGFPDDYMQGWWPNPPYGLVPANNFSISSPSVLRMYSPVKTPGNYFPQMMTAGSTGVGTYVGNAYTPPLFVEIYWKFDGSTYPVYWNGNYAFWMVSLDEMLNRNMPDGSRFVEFDMTEISGGQGAFSIWSHGAASRNPVVPLTSYKRGLGGNFSTDWDVFHKVQALWLSTGSTGVDIGLFVNFFDGMFLQYATLSYTATTTNPLLTPAGQPAGLIDDTREMVVIVNPPSNITTTDGASGDVYIDFIRLYTKP